MPARPAVRIACIGWGSLIWDGTREGEGPMGSEGVNDGTHSIGGSWRKDGPLLPVEYARLSKPQLPMHKRYLSLVIIDDPSVPRVPTLWAELVPHGSALDPALSYAVDRLGEREGVTPENRDRWIGRWPSTTGFTYSCSADIEAWAREKQLDGVVWTALPPRWNEVDGERPDLESAVAKLVELLRAGSGYAFLYIKSTPKQVQTAFRPHLDAVLHEYVPRQPEYTHLIDP